MPGRTAGADQYRYGFNGQERSTEVDAGLNSNTAEFWQYDARIGRRWNVDPKSGKYPWQSPYLVMNGNPVYLFDPLGLEATQSEDWVRTSDGQVLWDDRVKSQSDATALYGSDAIYRAPGSSYCGKGGVEVELGDNRQYKANGVSYISPDSTPSAPASSDGDGNSWYDETWTNVKDWWNTTDFVLQGEGKLTAGLQIGVEGSAWGLNGKVEGGYEVYDVANGTLDFTNIRNSKGSYIGASDFEQKVRNFAGAEGKFFSEKLSVGGSVERVHLYYNGYYGPQEIPNSDPLNWQVKIGPRGFGPGGQVSTSATVDHSDGKTFYGIDLGVGAKLVLGIDLKLKVGISR